MSGKKNRLITERFRLNLNTYINKHVRTAVSAYLSMYVDVYIGVHCRSEF